MSKLDDCDTNFVNNCQRKYFEKKQLNQFNKNNEQDNLSAPSIYAIHHHIFRVAWNKYLKDFSC